MHLLISNYANNKFEARARIRNKEAGGARNVGNLQYALALLDDDEDISPEYHVIGMVTPVIGFASKSQDQPL